ncbi:MAG: 4Fe-4S dicluster domain-containing protein [Promethearchaeota archaeon]|jgi:anaerobic dimethyl sulfoxide reductase subunit B (iron-sulfur subunit)
MKQLGFYFDQSRCIGCFTCSVACKDWYDIPAGPVNWIRVKAIEKGKFPNLFLAYLTIACNHCAEPPCVKACPVSAITKREKDGVVLINRDLCLGNTECGSKCLIVCPWDAPQFSNEVNSKMEKCDLCLDRLEKGQQTICVEACPMHALDVGTLEELQKKYGNRFEAVGFLNNDKIKPSIFLKPKKENKFLNSELK